MQRVKVRLSFRGSNLQQIQKKIKDFRKYKPINWLTNY